MPKQRMKDQSACNLICVFLIRGLNVNQNFGEEVDSPDKPPEKLMASLPYQREIVVISFEKSVEQIKVAMPSIAAVTE